MLKKLALSSVILLSACGGGGDDDESNVPTSGFVDGAFKDAAIAGVTYPNRALGAVGTRGRACEGETHYFETADGRIRVYGSTAFSETDFKVVATMLHDRLDAVLAKFGMQWKSFVEQRQTFNLGHHANLANNYLQIYRANNPNSDLEGTEAEAWQLWSSLSEQEQLDFVRDEYLYDSLTMNDVLLPKDALVACFNSEMSGSQFGEGSQFGVQVPPYTSTYHSGVGEIFTHEIVHFVQHNISNVGQTPYDLMPRWFTEGQAAYMAGQSVASVDHHHNYDPVQILSYFDEQETGTDTGFSYQHYALAYKYLQDSNGTSALVEMMQALKTNTDTPQQWQPAKEFDPENPDQKDEGLAFTRAFETFMEDHTGAQMTIERYRTTYHDLMNSWK